MEATAAKNLKKPNEAIEAMRKEGPIDQDIRVIKEIAVGECVRQGDLYVIRVNDSGETSFESGNGGENTTIDTAKFKNEGEYQLAPGNTMGSRHCIEDKKAVTMKRDMTNNSPVVGDLIVAKDRFTITHPEHAHHSLPAGTYLVAYQLDYATKERRMD